MFDWLTDAVSSSDLSYLVIAAASGGDVLFPVIPSETIVVTAGVIAGRGGLSVLLIIPLAALGAMIGDNIAYWLGRKIGHRVSHFLFRGEKGEARLRWAERAIQRRGGILVVVGRFIPGGRTASTFAAGSLDMPYRRFLAFDALAVAVWATYAAMLGYVGGASFEDSSWKPFAASLGAAGLILVAAEAWRQIQKRRGRDFLGDPLD